MSAPRIYDPKTLTAIAGLFSDIEAAFKKFEGDTVQPTGEFPLYVFSAEIVIRHRDDWTVGRIGIDDFLFFEITDETYGEKEVPR